MSYNVNLTTTSKVVANILNTCREMYNQGKLVNLSTLKITNPNHSNRDYVKALEIFNAEIIDLETCSVPLPDDYINSVTNMVKRIWTTLVRDNEQRFTEYKKKCESELDEVRAHRDQIWDENDKLKETLNLQKTLTDNQAENIKRLESNVEELRQKLREKSSLLSTLQGQYDVLKKNFERVTEWQTHQNKEQPETQSMEQAKGQSKEQVEGQNKDK